MKIRARTYKELNSKWDKYFDRLVTAMKNRDPVTADRCEKILDAVEKMRDKRLKRTTNELHRIFEKHLDLAWDARAGNQNHKAARHIKCCHIIDEELTRRYKEFVEKNHK